MCIVKITTHCHDLIRNAELRPLFKVLTIK
jgi:hypothetical protein